jgi:hypothetical protein
MRDTHSLSRVSIIFIHHHATKTASLKKLCRNREGIMLQRYDISVDVETNRLSIKEFAVIERQFRKRDSYDPTKEKFSLMHEAAYDGEDIREAINQGDGALISALRSDNFYPISACVELIAERVIELFNGNSDSFSELFFDDRILLSKEA